MDIFKKERFWRKKKPLHEKPHFWAILTIIVIILAFITSSREQQEATNVEEPAEDLPDKEVRLSYGEPVSVDGVSYRIKKVDREASIPLSLGAGPKVFRADGIFYIVIFEIVNLNEQEISLKVPEMWVTSSEGDYFAPRKAAEARFATSMKEGEAIIDNIPLERVRVFDVSPGIENLGLMIDAGDARYYLPLNAK